MQTRISANTDTFHAVLHCILKLCIHAVKKIILASFIQVQTVLIKIYGINLHLEYDHPSEPCEKYLFKVNNKVTGRTSVNMALLSLLLTLE